MLQEDKGIQYDGSCARWFHADYAKLSNTKYSRLVNPRTNSENRKWLCRRDDDIDGGQSTYYYYDEPTVGAYF